MTDICRLYKRLLNLSADKSNNKTDYIRVSSIKSIIVKCYSRIFILLFSIYL